MVPEFVEGLVTSLLSLFKQMSADLHRRVPLIRFCDDLRQVKPCHEKGSGLSANICGRPGLW